jgi:hypothetical protein
MFLHNLLNVLAKIENKMGLQKKRKKKKKKRLQCLNMVKNGWVA